MVTLSLDTNVFIDLMRWRRPRVRERHKAAILNGETLVASLIVFHELHFGVAASSETSAEERAVGLVLRGISIEAFTEQDMVIAAELRARLKRLGLPIGPYDTLIAGQALARGWTLVTSNLREFERIPGLEIQDWSKGV